VAIRPYKADRAADHGDPIQSPGGSAELETSLVAAGPDQVVAGQLRRRREASDRLPPLDDRKRDPLDPKAKPPRFRRQPFAFITVDTQRGLALIRGPHGIRDCLDFVIGDQYGWSRAGRGWVFDATRVPDIQAYAQWWHTFVIVTERERKEVTS